MSDSLEQLQQHHANIYNAIGTLYPLLTSVCVRIVACWFAWKSLYALLECQDFLKRITHVGVSCETLKRLMLFNGVHASNTL